MKACEQTYRQIARALRKAATKFPTNNDCLPLTDIFLQVKQESGELLVYDDDSRELTRCVVEEWIGNTEEHFYSEVQPILVEAIQRYKEVTENFPILKPYSFVLIGEDGETIADLYLVDDETIFISDKLMEGLEKDLDDFWENIAHIH